MMKSKIIIYKANSIRKKNPEMTFKEAYRKACIGHNYKMKSVKENTV
ncbi:hypothetical protein [Lysinibacillus fusiformis]|nr:hypothetical protein [Lysinibacillus fusiformis]MDC6267318.1 hypothetical protein [Lysinibacillus sphaericus]MDN4968248.1 hypothetical protein [Lysinibacillus fusiformis]MDN4968422.1 hypothetical protein [Lysinibacillus fusiformis]